MLRRYVPPMIGSERQAWLKNVGWALALADYARTHWAVGGAPAGSFRSDVFALRPNQTARSGQFSGKASVHIASIFDGARRAAQSLRQLGFIKKSIAGDGRVCWLGLNLHSIVCLVIGGVDSANFMSKNKEAQKLTLRPRQRGYLLAPLFAQSRHVPQLQHYMNVRVRLDLEKQLQPQNKRGWSVVGQPRWQCHKRRQF